MTGFEVGGASCEESRVGWCPTWGPWMIQETWWATITRRSVSTRPVLPWLAKVARATLILGEGDPGRERRSVSESFRITAGQTARVVLRKP
jgi:hypothetical protein